MTDTIYIGKIQKSNTSQHILNIVENCLYQNILLGDKFTSMTKDRDLS